MKTKFNKRKNQNNKKHPCFDTNICQNKDVSDIEYPDYFLKNTKIS